MGREYVLAHRAYRRLAVLLSNAGFPTLRFDLYGCGDSGGEFEQAGIRQWLTDVSTAIDEVKARCSFPGICLVGFRLGASLSMMAGAERDDIESIVLWDPIVSGRAYIEELKALHKTMLSHSYERRRRWIIGSKRTEILGFPFSDAMLAELRAVDLLEIGEKPAKRLLVVESREERALGELTASLRAAGVNAECQNIPGLGNWITDNEVLVPPAVLQSIVSWISRTSS
jgi:pimeloyl-ACP methyl ester carboxylesterase